MKLEHHGILGMKWGVRRFQNADGSRTAAGKKRYTDGTVQTTTQAHKDYAVTHDKTPVRMMSTKDLTDRITRLQMEKRYRDLTQTEKEKGKSFVDQVLSAADKTAKATSTFINLYNNYNTIKKMLEKSKGASE